MNLIFWTGYLCGAAIPILAMRYYMTWKLNQMKRYLLEVKHLEKFETWLNKRQSDRHMMKHMLRSN